MDSDREVFYTDELPDCCQRTIWGGAMQSTTSRDVECNECDTVWKMVSPSTWKEMSE